MKGKRIQAQREEVQRTEEEEGTVGLSFDEMTNQEFYFSSGVGAWRTILEIEADGSFSGVYSDSDMGAVGEGYPNGTYYICEFEGTFTQPEKINEYTYSMQIEQLDYEHAPETQEIIDGVLYSYSTAYGLEGAEEIYIYLPGAPFLELPQEYRNWVLHDMVDPDTEELPFYGLYNVKEQNGFSSYVISDKIYDMVAEAMVMNLKAADLTKERVYELYELLK